MVEQVHLIDPELAETLINAETVTQAQAAISAIERSLGRATTWRPVGDIKFNHGPVQMGVDPATQLIERIINAQEACVELEAGRRRVSPNSPHAAASLFFDVQTGGLSAMKDERGIRALAERTVSVTMAESGTKQPTIIVQDRGIGQHPTKFASTLLGLHLSDKPSKPYLIGQYGQGGASTLMHSKYTIFVSRRAPDLASGMDDLVGVAVVRFREAEVRGGTYEYLTKGNAILAIPAVDAPSPFREGHGTRVTHIGYNLHGFTSAYRQMKTGLWALLNAALFDPVLPVHIKGKRKVDTRADKGATTTGRIAKGNAAVLSGLPNKPLAEPRGSDDGEEDDADEAQDGEPGLRRRRGGAYLAFRDPTQTLRIVDEDGDHGAVRVNIWVLGGTDTTDTYVRAEQAVTITLAGQRHGKQGREFLKTCKLGFLSKRMIVQIEADALTREAKRQAFPSGREQQRNTALTELIFKELAEYLVRHERIRELEDEARAQALANASSRAKESVRKKVAKLMQRHLAGLGGAQGRAPAPAALSSVGGPAGRTPNLNAKPKPRTPKPPPDDSMLAPIPTQMEIANSELTLPVGATTHAILNLNAKNGYLADHGDDLRVEIEPVCNTGNDGHPLGGSSGGPVDGGPAGPGEGGGGAGGGSGGGGGRGGHGIHVKGMGSLQGGRARLVLGSDANAVPGEYAIRVSLVTPGAAGTLVAVGTVEVVPAPAVAGGQDLGEGGTPEIEWYRHPDDAGPDDNREELEERWPAEWTDKSVVGEVDESGHVIVFRLNRSYPDLKQAIGRRASSAKGSESAVNSLEDRYAAMVTFGMWLLHDQRKKDTVKWPPEVFQAACGALARSTLATMLDLEAEEDAGNAAA